MKENPTKAIICLKDDNTNEFIYKSNVMKCGKKQKFIFALDLPDNCTVNNFSVNGVDVNTMCYLQNVKYSFNYKDESVVSNSVNNIDVYVNAVLNNIFKDNIKLIKCIGRHKNALIYLVRVKDADSYKDAIKAVLGIASKKEYSVTEKFIKTYEFKKSKSKFCTIFSALDYDGWDIAKLVLSIIVFIISAALAIYEIKVEYRDNSKLIMKILYIGFYSISSLLSFIVAIFLTIKDIVSFEHHCNLTTTVSSVNKKDREAELVEYLGKEEIRSQGVYDKEEIRSRGVYDKYESKSFTNSNGYNKDVFYIKDSDNEKLSSSAEKMPVRLRKFKQKLNPDSKKALACIVTKRLNEDKLIFNDKLLGMRTDVPFMEGKTIEVKRVSYYNYVSADDLIYKDIVDASDPNYYFSGLDMCLYPINGKSVNGNEKLGLRNYEGSPLTNLIGVNLIVVLVIGDKKYIIANRQAAYNDANGGSLVPSASGSLSKKDYKVAQKKAKKVGERLSFSRLLETGMIRELEEESFITTNEKSDNSIDKVFEKCKAEFKILGYARLLSKGGKPDYFGKLTLTFDIGDYDDEKINEVYNKVVKALFKNYNKNLTKVFGKPKIMESSWMSVIPLDDFLNDKIYFQNKIIIWEDICSPQLLYIRYFLKKCK